MRDDSKFESYLRKFRPVSPEKLVFKYSSEAPRRPLFWLLWGCATAAILIAVLLVVRLRTASPIDDHVVSRETRRYTPPLTAGRANAELSEAPSAKDALDRMAFPPQPQLAAGEQSALSVLRKEKIKL